MYIVTIREKGEDNPLLERECDCALGAFGSAGKVHFLTSIQGDRETLISTYASALMGLKALETELQKKQILKCACAGAVRTGYRTPNANA